jgi:hypothetical protein
MGKYSDLESDIFSIFATNSWRNQNIKTVPENYSADNMGKEYIRVSIVPGGAGINVNSVSGVLIVDIFIAAGQGPKRTGLIADKLDEYLVGKYLQTSSGGTTQLFGSTLSKGANDADNPTLYRSNYTIPFNYSGVL